MSDAASSDTTPPRPKPKAKRFALKTRATASQPLIQIDGLHETAAPKPWMQVVLDDLRTRAPGIAVSVGIHLLILFVLGLFVIRAVQSNKGPGGIEGLWMTGDEMRAGDPKIIPVKIEAVKIDSSSKAPVTNDVKKPETAGTAGPGPGPGPVPVKAVGVGGMLGGRGEGIRRGLMGRAGGDDKIERAISSGLMWLDRQQQAGGNWRLHEGYPDAGAVSIRTDTGATALALLPFLGTGNTHLGGQYVDTVRKGINWLKSIQKANGDFHDHDELGRQTAFYAHAQATIVLCEALALTRDETLREPAERGINFLLAAQQPTLGGWKYQPQNDKTVGDLSVTGWALMALHTARAAGIDISEDAYIRASGFLDTVASHGGARYRYEPTHPASDFSASMTAEGLVCRQFLGWPKDHPAMADGIAFLMQPENLPDWSGGRRNIYAWYYTGHALHNVGGPNWKAWYGQAARQAVDAQVKLGSTKSPSDVRGSWSPKNPVGDNYEYGTKAGRLYMTAMSLLVLEMPFRHMPVYRSAEGE